MRAFAHFISIVFHPLFFPSYAALYIIAAHPYRFAHFDSQVTFLSLAVVFITTFLFPVFSLVMVKALGFSKTFTADDRKDRIIPYIAGATFYLWAYKMFQPGHESIFVADSLLSTMLLGATVSIFICFFINNFKKVSLHAAGMGNVLGLLLYTYPGAHYQLEWLFVLVIVAAGLVGLSRLVLKAHEPVELYMGYIVGFLSQYVAFLLIPELMGIFRM